MRKHVRFRERTRVIRDGPANYGREVLRQEKRSDEQHERQQRIARHNADKAWVIFGLVAITGAIIAFILSISNVFGG